MEFFQDNIPMVTMASAAAALYARKLSSLLRPGFPRQVALLPLFPLLTAAPFAFTSSSTLRLTTSLFLTWLCSFKLALLAAGHGPLDPALPVLKFLFIALLPVKLKKSGGAAASTKAKPLLTLASCMVKVAIIAAILRLYQYRSRLHLYVRYTVYNLHLYCYLDVLFPCIAASASLLGMETVPQFDKPYLASSLRDFWGRRWNLMVSAIFKLSVYDPVRARAGIPAGVLTTFLVSGLMHEGSLCYYGLQRPNGEMTAFFLLHGVCCIAEGWMAQWWTARGWPSPPRAMATLLVILFITATSWWLFTPSLCKDGLDEKVIDAWVAAGAFFVDAARKVTSYVQCWLIGN